DDQSKTIFSVKISKYEFIEALKVAIKDAKPNVLAHVDADQLELWKADTPFGIHVLIKVPLPALLSESDFLELCPPPLGYINRNRSTGSARSLYAHTPGSVVTWNNFENDVKCRI
ncbi:10298_t:CDS:2, partial [Paraglomus occultum]